MIARPCPVPRDGLLNRYVEGADGVFTDCYEVMHPLGVDLPAFITAFYTTWLFRLERAVLTLAFRKRITDAQVAALAAGQSDSFAAWTVEDRATHEILLSDVSGGTRSYLAVAPKDGGVTRLVFGSAIVTEAGAPMPAVVKAFIPAHRLYSKALLRTAERKLRRG